MGDEDLEATDNLCQRNRSIVLPVLNSFHVVHEDNIVLLLALVVDLGLLTIPTSHSDDVGGIGSFYGSSGSIGTVLE